jgi:hypothetical protein
MQFFLLPPALHPKSLFTHLSELSRHKKSIKFAVETEERDESSNSAYRGSVSYH